MNQPLLHAQDVAEYFLANVDEEAGDNISNLKLQKLLYYAQGFHVAMHDGDPLFSEPVVAWDHGPVVEAIYFRYSKHGWQGIDPPIAFDNSVYPPDTRELLDVVYGVYGQFSAKRLELMTHDEPPWMNTSRNAEITLESLRGFFSLMVEEGRNDRSVHGEPVWPTNAFRFQDRRAISRRMVPHRDRLGHIARQAPSDANPWADDD
jgi:uncharacterized phage-associated protein